MAACFWMTKRSLGEGSTLAAPLGSAVTPKSRMDWYFSSLRSAKVAPPQTTIRRAGEKFLHRVATV